MVGGSPEYRELDIISELLAEDVDARIPQALWRERLATMEGADSEPSTTTPAISVANTQSLQPKTISTPLSPVPEEAQVSSSQPNQLELSRGATSGGTSSAAARSDGSQAAPVTSPEGDFNSLNAGTPGAPAPGECLIDSIHCNF